MLFTVKNRGPEILKGGKSRKEWYRKIIEDKCLTEAPPRAVMIAATVAG